jgi:integrase
LPPYFDEARKQWRYRYRGKIAGQKVYVAGTPSWNTKRAAEAEERIEIERKRRELENPRLARKIPTLNDWAKTWLSRVQRDCAYSTYAGRESHMRIHWLPRFGSMYLDELTKGDIQLVIDELSDRGYSGSTVRGIGGTLLSCLHAALNDEILDRVPKVRRPKEVTRDDFLSEDETSTLIAACQNTEEHCAILLGVRAGLRHGEIRGLQWSDWQRKSRSLRVLRQVTRKGVTPPKWGHTRVVPVHADLELAMDTRWRCAALDIPWVFHRRGERFSEDTLDLLLGRILKRVPEDLRKRTHWHLLRHTCASHLATHGVALLTIGEILGHKNWKTTQRYAKLSPCATVRAIDMIPAIAAIQPGRAHLRVV